MSNNDGNNGPKPDRINPREETTPEQQPDSPDDTSDPRLHEPQGDEGIPAPLIDTPQNLPGDQPIDDTPPSRTKATGDS